jgi:hypothetical protein
MLIKNNVPLALGRLVPVEDATIGGAQLDSEHVGDIRGGFGTIRQHDVGPRGGNRESGKLSCQAL